MYTTFNKIWFFLLIISCFSCLKSNETKISDFKHIVPQNFEGKESFFSESKEQPLRINVDKFQDPLVLTLSSFVDSIWYIKLSNEEEATIGVIDKINFFNDCIYVLDRYKTKSLKKFTKDGIYLSTIGGHGEGPGEYAEPTDFIITDDEVIIYDQFGIRLNYYNHQGAFLRSKKLPFLFFQFHQFSANQYLFSSLDNDNDHLKSIVNYSIFETDSNFVINKKGFFREKDAYSSIFIEENFSSHGELVYYHPPYSDTIFSINSKNHITPVYYIDFGKKKLPNHYLLYKNKKELRKVSDENKYAIFGGVSVDTQDFLYFEFALKSLVYNCIYSKESNQLTIGNTLNNDINYIFSFNNILTCIDKNTLVGYNQPYNIAESFKEHSREEWVKHIGEEYTRIAESINSDDNPILVFFKLKEN